MKAQVVIGMGYGDEGKGRMVDYFCDKALKANLKPLVVRYNGGAQAGHTVVTPEGQSQIFHHIGAGSLLGVPTYLSAHFYINPTLFVKEHILNCCTEHDFCSVTCHPEAFVTTPYDMILNQKIEGHRRHDGSSHGSCGVGVYETKLRSSTLPLRIGSLVSMSPLELALFFEKCEKYFRERLHLEGISLSSGESEFLKSSSLFPKFYKDCMVMFERMRVVPSCSSVFKNFDCIIFEGAQGLLLSKVHGDYPHLTPSDPGISNALKICVSTGIKDVEVIYTTRAYTTRHGVGPLRSETPLRAMGLSGITKETNKYNIFQGAFRYAPLDRARIVSAARKDFCNTDGFGGNISLNLAVTCLDQMDEASSITSPLYSAFKPCKIYECWGPTRVSTHEKEF